MRYVHACFTPARFGFMKLLLSTNQAASLERRFIFCGQLHFGSGRAAAASERHREHAICRHEHFTKVTAAEHLNVTHHGTESADNSVAITCLGDTYHSLTASRSVTN
jgi:hypothetical protein